MEVHERLGGLQVVSTESMGEAEHPGHLRILRAQPQGLGRERRRLLVAPESQIDLSLHQGENRVVWKVGLDRVENLHHLPEAVLPDDVRQQLPGC